MNLVVSVHAYLIFSALNRQFGFAELSQLEEAPQPGYRMLPKVLVLRRVVLCSFALDMRRPRASGRIVQLYGDSFTHV